MQKKRILAIAAALLLAPAVFARGRKDAAPYVQPAATAWTPFTVTDMGGRNVFIEKPVKKAYAINLIGIIYIRCIDISLIGGWTNPLSEDEKKYIPPELHNLPMLGGWSSANPNVNIEELINADIDLILVTAAAVNIGPNQVRMADNIQSQTGITTLIVSNNLADTGNAFRLAGKVLGNPERGEMLGKYCDEELARMEALINTIPEPARPRLYYAEGNQGLETDPSGSSHTQAFDFVRAINVADVAENTANGMVGQSVVSLEQIIAWNPDFIIRNTTYTAADPAAAVTSIINNRDWAGISAVQKRQVYQTPALPNNWIDRAPSSNRILGVKWLLNLFYPSFTALDIRKEARDFFHLFYQIDLSDSDLDFILAAAEPVR
jgi:iron complex transport system substrate-binding protein